MASPPDSRRRAIVAVIDGISATFTESDWDRLSRLLDAEDVINGHDRLRRSMYFGDDDYDACVADVVHLLLEDIDLSTLVDVSAIGPWLEEHRSGAYRYVTAAASGPTHLRTTTLPDLDLVNPAVIREHLDRATAWADTDPGAAIGAAKDLVESTTKLVLDSLGEEFSAKATVPELVRAAQRALKLHPEIIAPDAAGAKSITKVLGALATTAVGVAELRNLYGTGHGRTQIVYRLSARHAHLAVGAADTYCRMMLTTLGDPEAPWRP